MRSRAPIALLLALACVLLASCRTNVGVAAHVNGSTITESQVGKYISSSGVDTAYAAQLQQQGTSAAPSRTVVLQLLIQDQLFDRALATNGGVPSQGVLAALSQRSRTLLSGGGPAPTNAQLRTELAKAGITASFLPQFLDAIEKEYLLVQRLGLTQQSQLAAVVKKAGADVTVSPRYGTWKPDQLAIDGGKGQGVPAFVNLGT